MHWAQPFPGIVSGTWSAPSISEANCLNDGSRLQVTEGLAGLKSLGSRITGSQASFEENGAHPTASGLGRGGVGPGWGWDGSGGTGSMRLSGSLVPTLGRLGPKTFPPFIAEGLSVAEGGLSETCCSQPSTEDAARKCPSDVPSFLMAFSLFRELGQ